MGLFPSMTREDAQCALNELDARIGAALDGFVEVDDADLNEWLELSNWLADRIERGCYHG